MNSVKNILLVFGTRPEAIKMCPVIRELKSRKRFNAVVCVTGQHREMLGQILNCFDITADYDLNLMKENQSLFDITTGALDGLRIVLEKEQPDEVLIQGDTTTAFAAALACFYKGIPVGHIEAGLRTYDIGNPYPEEFNREAISLISRHNFAPTKVAAENLIREGRNVKNIFVTGNTVCDAFRTTISDSYTNPLLDWAKGSRLVLITSHRRESLGEKMSNMFRAVRRVLEEHPDVKVIFPMHPNPIVMKTAESIFGDMDTIRLIAPLDVVDFHNFMKSSYLILTDSGGIQEEATILGKPVLVMRDTTERPEGISAGTLKLVGTEEKKIYTAFSHLLDDKDAYKKMSVKSDVYGDGLASKRIADILEFEVMR